MKKIYPKEWLELHPYKKTDSVDQYYVGIANEIYEVLFFSRTNTFNNDNNMRYASLCLAAWFEDVISQTGIWQTFTAECKRKYGAYLPFYPINNEYYPDEINLEDVYFLLWHHIQYLHYEEDIVIPENYGIGIVAQEVYELLTDKYETAPENERMQKFLCHPTMGEKDFDLYIEVLEWFHYHCYFNIENTDQFVDETEELIEKEQIADENIGDISHAIYTTLMLKGRRNLLALTSPEWLALLGKNHSANKLWADVRAVENSCYLLKKEDKEYLYLKDMCQAEGEFKVVRKSLDPTGFKNREVEKSTFICELVYYGNVWWQYGMLVENKLDKKTEEYVTNLKETKGKMSKKATFHDFMKATGGKFFVFCNTKKEIEDFFKDKMGYIIDEELEIPKIKNGAMLTAGPQIGLHVQTRFCECIHSDENPFYDYEKAKENAVLLMLDPNVVPYEVSCILQDKNMLPDACLNMAKGQEYGQQFLHANARFMTDYHYHLCREKDFDDKELLEYINV